MNHQESKNTIELLKQGDQKTLEKIYLDNREGFINFSRKYNVDESDAIDIYQDSILILRENASTAGSIICKAIFRLISLLLANTGFSTIFAFKRK